MASPQLVAHVEIPVERLRRELAKCAAAGFHGHVSIEIRISPEIVVDRIQTFKATATEPQKSWSKADRDTLVERAMVKVSEDLKAALRTGAAESVTITGHFNDGRMLQMDLQEVTK